jgi:hypothetical protein
MLSCAEKGIAPKKAHPLRPACSASTVSTSDVDDREPPVSILTTDSDQAT